MLMLRQKDWLRQVDFGEHHGAVSAALIENRKIASLTPVPWDSDSSLH